MYHVPMSDDLIAHYAGFTIKVALTMHRSGKRWTSSFTLIPGETGMAPGRATRDDENGGGGCGATPARRNLTASLRWK